jgi:hypothetical protein
MGSEVKLITGAELPGFVGTGNIICDDRSFTARCFEVVSINRVYLSDFGRLDDATDS